MKALEAKSCSFCKWSQNINNSYEWNDTNRYFISQTS